MITKIGTREGPCYRDWILLVVATVAFALASTVGGQGPNSSAAIEHVTVIDVETGARLADQTVLIEGNQIAGVGSAATVEVPTGARGIDGRGKFLIPGLWQMHAHDFEHYGIEYGYRMAPFQLYIANGVTGLRDMGSTFEQLLVGKERLQGLGVAAPRIVAAGPLIEGPQEPNPRTARLVMRVASPEEGLLVLDAMILAGMDFIKIHGDMTPETYYAMAEEANRKNMPFAGHIPAEVSVVEASDAGQVSIEHLGPLRKQCVREGAQGAAEIDVPKCEAVLERLQANGTFWGPTLLDALPLTADHPFVSEERTQYVKARKRATFPTFPEGVSRTAQAAYELSQRLTRMAADAGVRLIASTDSAGGVRLPGFSAVDELILFVEAGVSPLDALRAGTLHPAILLDKEDSMGTVALGKLADLVLLDGDPLIDIRNLRRVAAVVADGRVFEAPERQVLFDDVLRDAGDPN